MCTRSEAIQLSAELRESTHVDGKARMRTVSTLGSIDVIYLEDVPDDGHYSRPRQRWHWHERRERFWRNACQYLARLQDQGTITAEQAEALMARLAERVPVPEVQRAVEGEE